MSLDQGTQQRLRQRDQEMLRTRSTQKQAGQARVISGYLSALETRGEQHRAIAALAGGTLAIAAAAERLCDRLQEHQALDMQALADLQRLVIEHRAALARDRAIRSTGASA